MGRMARELAAKNAIARDAGPVANSGDGDSIAVQSPTNRKSSWKDAKTVFIAAILLRCPAVTSPDGAGSCLADRCHSLASLHLPQAALGSLPRFSLASPVQI